MTVSTTTSRGPSVTPVVDYEPPVIGAEPRPPARIRRPASRDRHLHAVTRPTTTAPSERFLLASAFADAALRSILEVIDRRRPVTQLRPLLAGGLADTVASFTRAAPNPAAAAILRRVRVQAILDSHDDRELAYEVAASYSRGSRTHAIACRVGLVATVRGERWQIVALHIG